MSESLVDPTGAVRCGEDRRMPRSAQERVRAGHAIERLQRMLDSARVDIERGIPPFGTDHGAAITLGALEAEHERARALQQTVKGREGAALLRRALGARVELIVARRKTLRVRPEVSRG